MDSLDVMTALDSTLAIVAFSDEPHKRQDKLELSLSEKRREHEKALLDMDTAEEQKAQQLAESNESSMFNLKESQTMLRDAKAALKKEQKAKTDAEDIMKETKEERRKREKAEARAANRRRGFR